MRLLLHRANIWAEFLLLGDFSKLRFRLVVRSWRPVSQSVQKVIVWQSVCQKGREPRTGPLRLCVCVFFFLYVDVETSQEISSPLPMDGRNSS